MGLQMMKYLVVIFVFTITAAGQMVVYGGRRNRVDTHIETATDNYKPVERSKVVAPPIWSLESDKDFFESYVDNVTATNVTALAGKSAYLSCQVRTLGNKTISWIRHRDIHILTVGSYTYTSDQRFQCAHHLSTSEWTLQIKWTQKRDAGIYECQISTQPVTSYFVRLIVVVPTATVLGGPDMHVDKGSTINLTCAIEYSPEPPAYVFWYHEDDGGVPSICPPANGQTLGCHVISYDSSRGGVSVITEKDHVTTSYLLIQHADFSDSGRYSCSPSNADVASIRVHVLKGERPAAMQTGSAGLSNSYLNIVILMILSYIHSFMYKSMHLNSPNFFAQSTHV